jgi:hypothetical protein
MCNCGKARTSASTAVSRERGPVAAAPARPAPASTIAFEYVGATGLTVFGGVTRSRYRFEQPGARVSVDARDVTSLDAVPVLRRAASSLAVGSL